MSKIKPQFIAIGVLSASLLVFAVSGCSNHKNVAFDSQKWQTNVKSRTDLGFPALKGKTKIEVLKILGKPDLEDTANEKTYFTYLVPSMFTKSAYYITFKNDIVVDTDYDESADAAYKEVESKKKVGK